MGMGWIIQFIFLGFFSLDIKVHSFIGMDGSFLCVPKEEFAG